MTSGWKESIEIAVEMFPIIALLMTMPFMIHQYRKYGSIPLMRCLCIYGFSFYLVCAYFLVIFPIPPIEEVANLTTPTMNLDLFNNISEWKELKNFNLLEPHSWLGALKDWKGLEPFCNIVMTIPFGVFLHYYCRKGFVFTTLSSFGLSAFFEISQLTALFGIYPRPYRLFDVNDLFNNTMGGVVGWIITPLLCWFLPTRNAIDEDAYMHSEKVSFPRRIVALVVDKIILGVVFSVIFLFVKVENEFYFELIGTIAIFTLLLYVTKGYTIGKKLLKIRLVSSKTGGRPGFFGIFLRTLILHGVILGFAFNPDQFLGEGVNVYLSGAMWGIGFLIIIVTVVDIIFHFSEKKRILLYEKMSWTKNIEI